MTNVTTEKRDVATTAVRSVRPCLTFKDQAEEAINHYVSIFPNSRIVSITRSDGKGPIPEGKVMHATFELSGAQYTAFDGGDHFQPSDAFSIEVSCDTQEELDRVWDGLRDGGEEVACGWVTDRFGFSWQVVPTQFGEMLEHPERGNVQRMVEAMLKMKKLDLEELQRAYASS